MISQNSIVSILNSVSDSLWIAGDYKDSDENVKWLEIFSYKCPSTEMSYRYGMTDKGYWALKNDLYVATEGHYLPFVPLLESPRTEVVALIKESLKNMKLPDVLIYSFPLDDILEFALKDKGVWSKFAKRWIDDGYPINDRIAELIPQSDSVKKWKRRRLESMFATDKQ